MFIGFTNMDHNIFCYKRRRHGDVLVPGDNLYFIYNLTTIKMKQKLIKISETHYIIVDDSEIKEGDYCTTHLNIIDVGKIHNSYTIFNPQNKEHLNMLKSCKKITHSTQQLKGIVWNNIIPISLSEVEEAINGYSVDYKLEDFEHERKKVYLETGSLTACEILDRGISLGFKAHQELMKDKLFTVENMRKAIQMAWEADSIDGIVDLNVVLHYGNNNDLRTKWSEEEIIQSLLPKTEWDVEFDEQGKIKLI
jgi:hypothetical protein